MNELIRVSVNESDEQIVSGRELHKFLEVQTPYHIWMPRRIEYGFTEDVDFTTFEQKCSKPQGGRPETDHALKLDMAKEMCMLEKNVKGKLARQYFIQLEKDWNSPEKLMARALRMADKEIGRLRIENNLLVQTVENQLPKVIFADSVSASKDLILIGELAKILRQNGIETGQKRLFEWMRENGYLIRRNGADYNMPTQYSMELGLFKIVETGITHSDGHVSIRKTPKVTGKGQFYFVNKLKNPLSVYV